jgi:ATP phosphoribosyltransferase regulatory subunit
MIHQAPAGARDLLPLEVAQKSWINDRLQQIFRRWGYKRIVTSSIEWVETLTAGDVIDPHTIIELQNIGSGRLGLRPELTASIGRAAVNRLNNNTIQRLCYRANVFRNPSANHYGRQLEYYQAGVELLFTGGVLADAEIILLLADSLHYLGLESWQLLLGDASLTRSILNIFPSHLQDTILRCIANLDRVTLNTLDLNADLKAKALNLFDLRGNPLDVLVQVQHFNLDEEGQNIVKHLQAVIELVNHTSDRQLPIILDLSLVQTFDYYTGIVFEVISSVGNQSYVVGQGGRYDKLLEMYHPQNESASGIGFCFNLEDLHTCLLNKPQLPSAIPPSDWLVVPKNLTAAQSAFKYAQNLRNQDEHLRVELNLELQDNSEIENYARNEGIQYIAWIDEFGHATVTQNDE